jgi:hypothetical protein
MVTRIVEGCIVPLVDDGWEVGGKDVTENVSTPKCQLIVCLLIWMV